jgi:hypothetical protein
VGDESAYLPIVIMGKKGYIFVAYLLINFVRLFYILSINGTGALE